MSRFERIFIRSLALVIAINITIISYFVYTKNQTEVDVLLLIAKRDIAQLKLQAQKDISMQGNRSKIGNNRLKIQFLLYKLKTQLTGLLYPTLVTGHNIDSTSILKNRTELDALLIHYAQHNPKFAQNIKRLQGKIAKSTSVIIQSKASVISLNLLANNIASTTPSISADMHEVLAILVNTKSTGRSVQKAGIQLMLIERINSNVKSLLMPNMTRLKSTIYTPHEVDRLSRDIVIFRSNVLGMLKGNKDLKINKVTDKEAITFLTKIEKRSDRFSSQIADLQGLFTTYVRAQQADARLQASIFELEKYIR